MKSRRKILDWMKLKLLDVRRKKTSKMIYLNQYMQIRAHFKAWKWGKFGFMLLLVFRQWEQGFLFKLENEVSSDVSYFWYSDNAIKLLWPDDSLLPNRKQLSSTLLDKCHQQVLTKIKIRMKGLTCCLTTDGWSNVKNDPVVNYMAVSPVCSFFLESVMTGQ